MQKRDIIRTEKFRKSFKKLPFEIKKKFDKQIRKLEDIGVDPYGMGDPLGYKWFRELKQEKYRVYFYIYENEIIILLLDTSDKKTQKEVIQQLKKYLRELRKLYIFD